MNKRLTVKEERDFLERMLRGAKTGTATYLFAECDGQIVGSTDVELGNWAKNHIGTFGIIIRNGFRGIGLGKHLMSEVIELSKKQLKPKPKIIQLEVFAINKPAVSLYKKMGFKIVAKLPKQRQWKGKLMDELVMLKYF